MSESFEIRSSTTTYKVELGECLLEWRLPDIGSAICLADRVLSNRLPENNPNIILLDATEQAKDLDSISRVIGLLKEKGANRKTRLIAIGGGVIQDIACFVASIYMRGMKWEYFPTTLLGMGDSCIGGKSSINAAGFKNLVGTFHPPEIVAIDPSFITTLNTEQRVAGLCEAVKICFAREDNSFERYLAMSPSVKSNASCFLDVIGLTLRTKKWFIETDEFDQNERLLLNFGHTFGHALEAATDFAVSHGVAVGIGMLCALRYSAGIGLSAIGKQRCDALARYTLDLLAEVETLPRVLATLDAALATKKFTADKKHDAERFWIIAPNADGFLKRVPLVKDARSMKQIEEIFAATALQYREMYVPA